MAKLAELPSDVVGMMPPIFSNRDRFNDQQHLAFSTEGYAFAQQFQTSVGQ